MSYARNSSGYVKLLIGDKAGVFRRLQEETVMTDTHFIFTGAKDSRGHGQLCIEGKTYSANRLSLYVHYDFDLNSKLDACHKTDCTRSDCWNPLHLYAGTRQENLLDNGLLRKGHAGKTHCPKGHEYTFENTYRKRNGGRECRACARIAKHEWYLRSQRNI